MQVLLTAPAGIAGDLEKLGQARSSASVVPAVEATGGGVIEISNLTVRFGGVMPIDDMTLTFERRHQRPDRPQRRRQDHVLQRAQRLRPPGSGYGRPRSATTCWRWPTSGACGGACAARSRPSRRSPSLSVYENVLLVHEHSGRVEDVAPADVIDAVEFVGLGRRIRRPRRTRSGPPSDGSSRSPERSSASRGWCCSTSRPPGCPTTRRRRSAR